MMIKKKRTIRRGKKKSKNNYFSQKTHDAIRDYQQTDLLKNKHEIYVTSILPAFNKLAENLIFIHKFAKTPASFEIMKNDCVTFLYETIHKFDPDRGTKAFSYFNVVAKNWLIIQSKKRTKLSRKLISIDAIEEATGSEISFHESFRVDPSQEKNIIRKESKEDLNTIFSQIKLQLKTEKEHACMDAIISLFDRVDELELLNKRAVFVYLRDISNLSPKQLSVTMSKIRKHYREISDKGDFFLFFGD